MRGHHSRFAISAIVLSLALAMMTATVRAAVVVSYDSGTKTLTVTGDGGDDDVTVTRSNEGNILVNGSTVDNGGNPVKDVDLSTLNINLGGGADELTILLGAQENLVIDVSMGGNNDSANAVFPDSGELNADMGDGTDSITVKGGDDNEVVGGPGTDRINFSGTAADNQFFAGFEDLILRDGFQTDLAGIEEMFFNGKGGNDSLNVVDLSNNRLVNFNGGGGNDFMGFGIGFGNAQQMTGSARFNGGSGLDFLMIDAFNGTGPTNNVLGGNGHIDLKGDALPYGIFRNIEQVKLFLGSGENRFTSRGSVGFGGGAPRSSLGLAAPAGAPVPPPLTIHAGQGNDRINFKAVDSQTGINLSSGADKGTGGSKKDVIRGEGGNDELRGLGGPDVLNGGQNNDECFGGSGQDAFTSCETKQQ